MNNFLVFMPGGSDSVKASFPQPYPLAEDSLWAVAADENTCVDVCERLGITPSGDVWGVVSKIEEYLGFYDRALWQKLNAWTAQG